MNHSSKIKITNSSDVIKIMCLEPWAEEFEMLPEMTFEILVETIDEGEFEVDFNETHITVYVWGRSVAKVLLKGKNICKAGHIRIP